MSTPPKPICVDILVLKDTTASGLYGLHDVLSSVGIAWESVVSGQPCAARFDVRIVAATKAPFQCATGGWVVPDAGLDDARSPDVVLVPGIRASIAESLASHERSVFDWLRSMQRRGSRIASACTGALVLAEAGLLDGSEATTHWAYRNAFRLHYPRVRLRLEKNLCCANDGVMTSGGTTAWQHLAMFLIADYCGKERAVQAAKFWLIPDSGDLQSPYMTIPGITHEDSTIRDCQLWIGEHYAAQNPVDAMIGRSCLASTTFSRRFRRATGYAPMEYVHAVRVEKAKSMLETTDRSIEHIGGKVGYEDTASFRRLFKRQTGLTPRDYRRLFGSVRFDGYESLSVRDIRQAAAGN